MATAMRGMPEGRRFGVLWRSTYQPKSPITTMKHVLQLLPIEWNSLTSLPKSTCPITAMQTYVTRKTIMKWKISWAQLENVFATASRRSLDLNALKNRAIIETAFAASTMWQAKRSLCARSRPLTASSSSLSLICMMLGRRILCPDASTWRNLCSSSALMAKQQDAQSPQRTNPRTMLTQSMKFQTVRYSSRFLQPRNIISRISLKTMKRSSMTKIASRATTPMLA
mmetsp:Transcript_12142/g.36634  ORF Transcript_12142/g.36634 Transcript_12142/m.36634 type:complete len:226 (+) Transcript_12142:777-1454(+)